MCYRKLHEHLAWHLGLMGVYNLQLGNSRQTETRTLRSRCCRALDKQDGSLCEQGWEGEQQEAEGEEESGSGGAKEKSHGCGSKGTGQGGRKVLGAASRRDPVDAHGRV